MCTAVGPTFTRPTKLNQGFMALFCVLKINSTLTVDSSCFYSVTLFQDFFKVGQNSENILLSLVYRYKFYIDNSFTQFLFYNLFFLTSILNIRYYCVLVVYLFLLFCSYFVVLFLSVLVLDYCHRVKAQLQ